MKRNQKQRQSYQNVLRYTNSRKNILIAVARVVRDSFLPTEKIIDKTQEECTVRGNICTGMTYLHSEHEPLSCPGRDIATYLLSWGSTALKDRNAIWKNTRTQTVPDRQTCKYKHE